MTLNLGDKSVGALKSSFDALGRLCRKLDGRLEEIDGELGVNLCRNPEAEGVVDLLRGSHGVQELIHVVQTKVTVL